MNKNKEIRVTSVDNPYDPFTHWEQWLLYDANAGYNTCGRLANVTIISDAMSDQEIYDNVEAGINELMKTGSINKKGELIEYKKVIR